MNKLQTSRRIISLSMALSLTMTGGIQAHAAIQADGGAVADIGGYRTHTFTGNGTFSVAGGGAVDVLVVAGGGGGGGGAMSGGGGAGGVLYTTAYPVATGDYTVTIGEGGLGGYAYNLAGQAGLKGENSSFGTGLTALGGGGGAGWDGHPSTSGGSGGGGNSSQLASSGTVGQGHDGKRGSAASGQRSGGGGGGAGQDGAEGIAGAGGKGGDGIEVFGSYYGGGGGGGLEGTPLEADGGGDGGLGGGGAGAKGSTKAIDADPNTGGGGGGAGYTAAGVGRLGGDGGSGIVIVRYPVPITNAGGATNITASSAWLNGTLYSTGTSATAVSVYWGSSDGATNASAWANTNVWTAPQALGDFTFQATSLSPSTNYYYRFATLSDDEMNWASTSAKFITGEIALTLKSNGDEATLTPGAFTVTRPATATNESLAVTYAKTGGTAAPGVDYVALSGSVTIPAGAASADIVVTPLKNYTLQSDTTLKLTLTDALAVIGTSDSATLTIKNEQLQASLYVSQNGDNSDGLTWATAIHSLPSALSLAAENATIHIAGGQTFSLTAELAWPTVNGVTLAGGYQAATDVEPGARDPIQWPTVISRHSSQNIRLIQISNVTNAVLSGLTLTGGNAVDVRGGAIHASGTGLTLEDCIITNNRASTAALSTSVSGGALYAENSTVTVRRCRLVANTAFSSGRNNTVHGGALAFSGGVAVLLDSDFRRNTAWGEGSYAYMVNDLAHGGAVYADGVLAVTNCLLIANHARIGTKGYARGGALYSGGNASLRNCLIAGNTVWRNGALATAEGHGVYATGGAGLAIRHVTFADQVDAIRIGTAPATLAVENSIFWDNTRDFVNYPLVAGALKNVANCLIGSGANQGTNGCFQANPRFERGYYLGSGSLAINAGNTTAAAEGFASQTTQATGTEDQGPVDWGYHADEGVALLTLYVAGSGSDANTGLSAGVPLRSMTKALALAGDGTRIVVGAGQYDGTVETFPLSVRDVIGLSVESADPGTAIVSAAGKNTRVILLEGVWQGRLSGLTLRDGIVTGNGGGLETLRCGLTISNCVFRQNTANRAAGGGFYAEDSLTVLVDLVADGNQCASNDRGNQLLGAGMGLVRGRHLATRCRIVNNLTQGQGNGAYNTADFPYGGGLYTSGDLQLSESAVSNNSARITSYGTARGGGIFADLLQADTKVVLRSTLVATNICHSAAAGDGIHLANGVLVLENVTVGWNAGSGLYRAGGTVTAVNTILAGNGTNCVGTVTLAYSCVGAESSFTDGGNNIVGDPLFIAPQAGDFRLQSAFGQKTPTGRVLRHSQTSPCLDAGLNQSWMAGVTDLQGMPRVSKSRPDRPKTGLVDLGAFEISLPPSGSQIIIR